MRWLLPGPWLRQGKPAEASSWLDEQLKADPNNKILKWAKESFEKKYPDSSGINDATVTDTPAVNSDRRVSGH